MSDAEWRENARKRMAEGKKLQAIADQERKREMLRRWAPDLVEQADGMTEQEIQEVNRQRAGAWAKTATPEELRAEALRSMALDGYERRWIGARFSSVEEARETEIAINIAFLKAMDRDDVEELR